MLPNDFSNDLLNLLYSTTVCIDPWRVKPVNRIIWKDLDKKYQNDNKKVNFTVAVGRLFISFSAQQIKIR